MPEVSFPCPKCGAARSSEEDRCVCGYDPLLDPIRNLKVQLQSGKQVVRHVQVWVGGIAAILLGFGLLIAELRGGAITFWGVLHPILLIVVVGIFLFVMARS